MPEKNKYLKVKKLNRLLPLVAIGTIADCQSIREPHNRLLVRSGLYIIKTNQHDLDGLTALLDGTGLSQKMLQGYSIGSQDIAFTFSPILNSSGRMSHAKLSIALMLAQKDPSVMPYAGEGLIEGSSQALADQLIKVNSDRKASVKSWIEIINEEAGKQFESGAKIIWIAYEGLSKGVVGLIASNLQSKFGLPVAVCALPENGLSKEESKELFELFFPQTSAKQVIDI
jgi:single-stranded-DNA-specific exonuclease